MAGSAFGAKLHAIQLIYNISYGFKILKRMKNLGSHKCSDRELAILVKFFAIFLLF